MGMFNFVLDSSKGRYLTSKLKGEFMLPVLYTNLNFRIPFEKKFQLDVRSLKHFHGRPDSIKAR